MVGDIQTRKHKAAAAQYTYNVLQSRCQNANGGWKLVFIQSKFHGERNKKKELKISGVEINKQKN
jgi:hypothetical protein